MSELRTDSFKKVVISRIKEIETQINLVAVFKALNEKYGSTYNYVFSSPVLGCWMGASPELLGSVKESKFQTVALAGTKTETETWSAKEIQEQKYVTDAILSTLTDFSEEVGTKGPYDAIAGPVVHLKTDIEANISPNAFPELIQQLHPTPATCGTPTDLAKAIILKAESHDRHLYTGYIGVTGPSKSEFFVNLRCMQITNNAAYLYLGGGLTIDSDLESEWNETERKAKTLEQVLAK